MDIENLAEDLIIFAENPTEDQIADLRSLLTSDTLDVLRRVIGDKDEIPQAEA